MLFFSALKLTRNVTKRKFVYNGIALIFDTASS